MATGSRVWSSRAQTCVDCGGEVIPQYANGVVSAETLIGWRHTPAGSLAHAAWKIGQDEAAALARRAAQEDSRARNERYKAPWSHCSVCNVSCGCRPWNDVTPEAVQANLHCPLHGFRSAKEHRAHLQQ